MTPNRPQTNNYKLLHTKTLFDGESQETIAIIQRSIKNVQEILEIDECSIALIEPGASALFLYSTRQPAGEQASRIALNEELANLITQQSGSIEPADLAALLHFPAISPGSAPVSITLAERGTVLGLLSVQSRTALDARQVNILSACGDQIAMTLSKMIQADSERQELTRAQASFFSMITHELRAPLNSINGYLELALSGAGGELNEHQYEFARRARMGSEQLYALLENLLLISRVDNGQMRLHREIIRLQDVIDNAVEELELSASDQNIRIEVNDVRTFPRIYADAVRLRQVLRNLISNALNFTPAHGQITISASRAEGEKSVAMPADTQQDDEKMGILKLQIRDTGVGIAPEDHARIFERFLQAQDETRRRAGSPGLGLTIVKMIVEMHGGSVSVESKLEHGSTFTCLLPCILP